MRDLAEIGRMQDLYNVGARDGYADSNDLIRSVDYMGIIIDCNQIYLDSLGYKKTGLSESAFTSTRHPEARATCMQTWRTGGRDTSARPRYG